MTCILNIETASSLCSVSFSVDGKTHWYHEENRPNAHSAMLAILVQEALESYEKSPDAIAVSIGPGSYTGLRIGLSMAKGLAYRFQIPLLAVPTLKIIASSYLTANGSANQSLFICPMMDARRNEVYTALYNAQLDEISSPRPLILDGQETAAFFANRHCIIIGNGAAKASAILKQPEFGFDCQPYLSAEGMPILSHTLYNNKTFADLAYVSPEYLKDFEAIAPRSSVLNMGTQFDK